jgi:glucose/arabinose dehydrogenase/PKD repeat protein
MHSTRRLLGAAGVLTVLVNLLPFAAAVPVLAESGASVPASFQDEAMFTGLDHPMAVAFAPNGNVFVAEKRGTIQFYTSVGDTTPSVFADLNTNVHNYWDRGLMGLAIDPAFGSGRPYVYVLYAYNHILGEGSAPPRWPPAAANPYDDRCPNPPAGTIDGCVISGRLSRLTASGGVMTGSEHVLVEDWCQQYPSHSVGALMFGPEGALYASGGEGASFSATADYGQLGGTLADTPTPINPCGDPGGSNPSPPTAGGGALRSQDLRTSGDPQGLGGTVIRIDPDTGNPWPQNANAGSSDKNVGRIIAYGLRNPYRFTIKPGTDDVWIGDVGWNEWEEVDTLPDPSAAPRNFGWPCYEGVDVLPAYDGLGLSICDGLATSDVAAPYYTYRHSASIVSGDGCNIGSSSISGLAFLPSSSPYPAAEHGALFTADYTRRCIWEFRVGSNGLPDIGNPRLFANLKRPGDELDGGSVFLTVGPTGDLVYADYDRGEIRRIHYYGANVPPVASFTATPSFGPSPLTVDFDASGSTDANHDTLSYAWDLDADGAYDDGTGVTQSHTYSGVMNVSVGLRVTDPLGAAGTATQIVSVANSPPSVDITSPSASLAWGVGDTISFAATGNDAQDGSLPASAYGWTLTMRHCPADCHSHIIETFTGVKTGSFTAPDHEYPSHLLLSVIVTDNGGLQAQDEVEIFPSTGSVRGGTSPTGIPITVGPATGAPPPAVTGIVHSTVGVSAPPTHAVGEQTLAFDRWSDGGARTHSVPIVPGTTTVTAMYRMTGAADRSNTCAGSPSAVVPSGEWLTGKFGSANDVDWYRFKLTARTRVRLVLGDLATPGRMALYSGCSKLLEVSDYGGLAPEMIIRRLPAGSYAVRLSGSGGSDTPNYSFRIKRMPKTVHVMSARTRIDGSTLRIVGEAYNNTSSWVGPVTVTARLYSASGKVLATRTVRTLLAYIPPRGRAPFSIDGPVPAGFHHASLSVTARPTSKSLGTPTTQITNVAVDANGRHVVSGTVRNPYSKTVTTLRVAMILYDARFGVLDVRRATVGATTLARGASTTFSGTFLPPGLVPSHAYARGWVYR